MFATIINHDSLLDQASLEVGYFFKRDCKPLTKCNLSHGPGMARFHDVVAVLGATLSKSAALQSKLHESEVQR